MPRLHPINQTLVTLLDNQVARTEAALEDLTEDLLTAEPGGSCNSILRIVRHLVALRRFQLSLLSPDVAEQVGDPDACEATGELYGVLAAATELLRRTIADHDPADWYRPPPTPRPGLWGEDPTLPRFARPFNDFTNHLGAIRAVRRILGAPVKRTQ